MLGRRAMAAASIATLLATALPSSPAAAAGGGCATKTGSGWNIGICTADNGVTVFADLYVNARGSIGSTCQILRWIRRFSSSGAQENIIYPSNGKTEACTVGYKPAITAPMVSGKRYRQYASVWVNGILIVDGYSKDYTY
ncbi:hypothetical protein [Herbidospora sp. RD11066]